jgi:hypothetical protein
MVKKKDLVIVALATFCLTATLFLIVPTRSQTGGYDPWLDTNDDGQINILEAILTSNHFLTSGDPAKNVMIAGHANNLAFNVTGTPVTALGGWFQTDWISLDEYSKLTVNLFSTATANLYILMSKHHLEAAVFYVDRINNITGDLVKTYDVPNQEIMVYFQNNGASACQLWIDIYLIA